MDNNITRFVYDNPAAICHYGSAKRSWVETILDIMTYKSHADGRAGS